MNTLVRASLWLVLIAVVAHTSTDPDLWGHVRFGLDALRDGGLAQWDSYSFTSDQPWINHEWLAEVLMGAAFLSAGSTGLVLLKVSVVLLVIALLHRSLRDQGVTDPRARDIAAALAIITTIQQAHHVRPQLFSLVGMSLLLFCLGTRSRPGFGLAWLPLIFAVWANLHGGWIVGGGVLAVWALARALKGDMREAAYVASVGGACLIATLMTPYGFELWRFLADTVGIGRADISEWQPVAVRSAGVMGLWAMTFVLAAVGLIRARRMHIGAERVAVVVTLAILSFQVSRLVAFFALATLFLLGAPLVAPVRPVRQSETTPVPVRSLRARLAPAVVVFAMLITAGSVGAKSLGGISIDPTTVPEPGAVQFLQSRSDATRVLIWFDWGQYAIWHLSPRMRVSIDGRRETVYSMPLREEHLRFYFDRPGGSSFPRTLSADYIWIPRTIPAAERLLAAREWVTVYSGSQSVIFQRSNARSHVEVVTASSDRPSRNFPGP